MNSVDMILQGCCPVEGELTEAALEQVGRHKMPAEDESSS